MHCIHSRTLCRSAFSYMNVLISQWMFWMKTSTSNILIRFYHRYHIFVSYFCIPRTLYSYDIYNKPNKPPEWALAIKKCVYTLHSILTTQCSVIDNNTISYTCTTLTLFQPLYWHQLYNRPIINGNIKKPKRIL